MVENQKVQKFFQNNFLSVRYFRFSGNETGSASEERGEKNDVPRRLAALGNSEALPSPLGRSAVAVMMLLARACEVSAAPPAHKARATTAKNAEVL